MFFVFYCVGDDQPPALYEKIAAFYERKRQMVQAAHFLVRARQPRRAVDLLLTILKKQPTVVTGTDDEDSILTTLVAATVNCDDASVAETVSQFLLGNDDGAPKVLSNFNK